MKPKNLIFLSLVLLTGYASFASALINPGDTLNPVVTNPVDCPNGPTDPTCIVTLPSGGSVTPTNGLSLIGSDIGLGGVLVQDTTINQSGFEFSITNNGTTFASGADPLNLLSVFGQAYPGIGMLTDGTATGGLQQWISAINDGSDPITVVGNFDFANSIQAGLIIEGIDTQLSSSDGVSGSSSVTVRGGSLNLFGSDGIDIYANNYVRFNNFGSGRDDSGTNFPTNFLYTDGSGNLQSAPTSLLGGGSFSLASQDEGSTLTSTTTGYNFIGAGVTATESGGLVTVNIPGGGGGSSPISVNGTTLYSSGLIGTGNTNGNNIFFGASAGSGATGASYSNFLGHSAGNGATGASFSNFLGPVAGSGATGASHSNFLGYSAGNGATGAFFSNFLGYQAGSGATDASNSNFLGRQAGYNATSANNSNFFGQGAGSGAVGAYESNFSGYQAGMSATGSYYSNFFGRHAGYQAIDSYDSNFFGTGAGYQAVNVDRSNFFGNNSGYKSSGAINSNFFGYTAGALSGGASNSNFFGYQTGYNATSASNSNFFGPFAGYNAPNASNSIFIGQNSGYNDTVNNTGDSSNFSILLGPNTSTGGFSNSIALGGSATNTASNQFMIGSTTRPIDQTKIIGSLGTECTITTGTGMACTSDQTLKTNITDLTTDTLDKLLKVKTVTYNWLQNPNSPTQIGFLAQDLEQYFPELVTTDSTGKKAVYYSQITPILVEAIREMNIKIDTLQLAGGTTSTDIFESLKSWLADASNGINDLYVKVFHADRIETKELCVGQTCLNEQQVQQILQSVGSQGTPIQNIVPTSNDPESTTGNTVENSDNSDSSSVPNPDAAPNTSDGNSSTQDNSSESVPTE